MALDGVTANERGVAGGERGRDARADLVRGGIRHVLRFHTEAVLAQVIHPTLLQQPQVGLLYTTTLRGLRDGESTRQQREQKSDCVYRSEHGYHHSLVVGTGRIWSIRRIRPCRHCAMWGNTRTY